MEPLKSHGYHNLIVHQRADKLVLEVYRITKNFPKDELFGLTSQMRRSAVSVPANIAEGYTRKGKKDRLHFYNMAQSSLVELEYYLELSCKLEYITEEEFNNLIALKSEAGRLLHGFIAKSS